MIEQTNMASKNSIYQSIECNHLRVTAILAWAISTVIQKPSTAVFCADKNSIAAKFASFAGFDTLYFASNDQVKRQGFWLWEQAKVAQYEDYLLDNEAINYTLSPRVEAGFEGLAKHPVQIQQVRFDEQYSAIKQLSLMHIAYVNAPAILRGSIDRIVKDKPIITLSGLATKNAVDEYIEIFDEAGYLLYGSDLQVISSRDDSKSATSFWFALPKETDYLRVIAGLIRFEQNLPAAKNDKHHAELIKRYYKSLLSYSTKSSELLESVLFGEQIHVPLEHIICDGLHDVEYDSDGMWRWTGKSRQSMINMCIPAPGNYFFRIHLADLPGDMESNVVAGFLEGKQVIFEEVYSGSVIEFAENFDVQTFNENVTLTLETENLADIYGKRMGISISNIEFYASGDELL
jgi:hypothetical protein